MADDANVTLSAPYTDLAMVSILSGIDASSAYSGSMGFEGVFVASSSASTSPAAPSGPRAK
jgi:hypothetical protein